MKARLIVVLLGAVFFAVGASLAGQTGNLSMTTFEQKLIAVENLGAEFHSGSGIVVVTARITNISQAMLRGYATIYLLSAEGKKIHAFQEEINDGEAFAHGATVEFKASSKVGGIKNVALISVDFTQS